MQLGTYTFVPERSAVRVTARAPGHAFTAKGSGIEGRAVLAPEGLVELEAHVALSRLAAPDPLGQHQLHKFLDFDRNPIARAQLLAPVLLEGEALRGRARMRFSIAERSAETEVVIEGTTTEAEGRFELRFTALGYTPPRLLLFRVKDDLAIVVTIRTRHTPG